MFENIQKLVQRVGVAVLGNNSNCMYTFVYKAPIVMFRMFLLKMVLDLVLYRPTEVWS